MGLEAVEEELEGLVGAGDVGAGARGEGLEGAVAEGAPEVEAVVGIEAAEVVAGFGGEVLGQEDSRARTPASTGKGGLGR